MAVCRDEGGRALAGYASVTANNAVNYAARVASVTQRNAAGEAMAAAGRVLQSGVGTYQTQIQADSFPGGTVQMRVQWEVRNFFGSLMPLFGGDGSDRVPVEAVSLACIAQHPLIQSMARVQPVARSADAPL